MLPSLDGNDHATAGHRAATGRLRDEAVGADDADDGGLRAGGDGGVVGRVEAVSLAQGLEASAQRGALQLEVLDVAQRALGLGGQVRREDPAEQFEPPDLGGIARRVARGAEVARDVAARARGARTARAAQPPPVVALERGERGP